MKRILSVLAIAAVACGPAAFVAEAKDKPGKVKIKIKPGKVKVKVKPNARGAAAAAAAAVASGVAAGAAARDCPPGLAKKNPPCIPPGLVRTAAPDTIDDYDGRAVVIGDDDRVVDLDDFHFHGAFAHAHGGDADHTHVDAVDYEDAYIVAEDGELIAVGDLIAADSARFAVIEDPVIYNLAPLDPGERYLLFGDSVIRVDAETNRLLTLVSLAEALAN